MILSIKSSDRQAMRGCVRRGLLLAAGLMAAAPAWAAMPDPPQAVILIYHRFGEDDAPSTNIRLAQFEAQLDWLEAEGAHFISLGDIVTALKQHKPLPDFSVAVTADDGYASIASEAWPRLKARHIPLALFIATDAIDQGAARMMDWQTIRRLRDEGVTIGHHGAAHGHMAGMAPDAVKADIEKASVRFKEELGAAPPLFAYPYGEYSAALAAEIKALGFAAGFAQFSSVASPAEDLYALPRFAINAHYGEIGRFKIVARAKALPVADVTPHDPWLTARNPPEMEITLKAPAPDLGQLNCYASTGAAPAPIYVKDRLIRVQLEKPFPPGRSRVNCTLPAGHGRWYWLGRPFFNGGGND